MKRKDDGLTTLLGVLPIAYFIFNFWLSPIPLCFGAVVYWLVMLRMEDPDTKRMTKTILAVAFVVVSSSAFILYRGQPYFQTLATWHYEYFSMEAIAHTDARSIPYFFASQPLHGWLVIFTVPSLIFALTAFCACGMAGLSLKQHDSIKGVLAQQRGGKRLKPRHWKRFTRNMECAVPIGLSFNTALPVAIPHDWLKQHLCLIGTTGAGKTVSLYNFIINAALNRKAIVFVDGKGDQDNIRKFKSTMAEYGIPCSVVTMDGNTAYNAFSSGTPDELTDKIIGLFDWSEEHYKLGARSFLQQLLIAFTLRRMRPTLSNVVEYCDRRSVKRLLGIKDDPKKAKKQKEDAKVEPFGPEDMDRKKPEQVVEPEALRCWRLMENVDPKAVSGLQGRIAALAEGDLRPIFQDGGLDLADCIERKEAVLFSLDSLRYPEQSRALGRLIVNDLKTAISVHSRNSQANPEPVALFFDEFNVFASHQVVDIINKSRSAGFEALLSFQSLSDIDKLESGEPLRRQIIQNCNTLIVQKQNDHKDAEELASLFGTKEALKSTAQSDDDEFTGMMSNRLVREFVVHPDDIKRLEVGQAFVRHGVYEDKVQMASN
ncbi:MAG: type IV secretory system conjugative DNA transfer family protein [Acidobacteriota bacterium]